MPGFAACCNSNGMLDQHDFKPSMAYSKQL